MQVTRKMEHGLLPQQTKKFHKYNEAVAEKHEEGNKNCFGSFYG